MSVAMLPAQVVVVADLVLQWMRWTLPDLDCLPVGVVEVDRKVDCHQGVALHEIALHKAMFEIHQSMKVCPVAPLEFQIPLKGDCRSSGAGACKLRVGPFALGYGWGPLVLNIPN